MTGNQIAYWSFLETKDNNRQVRDETKRHNVAAEAETVRHNKVSEDVDISRLQETQRHNLAEESYDLANLAETQRHNIASEQFNIANLAESQRHNVATENETSRHNLASESVDATRQQETQRHNLKTEELEKIKLQLENIKQSEVKRANQVNELLRQVQNNIAAGQLDLGRYNAQITAAYNREMMDAKNLEVALNAQGKNTEASKIAIERAKLSQQYNISQADRTTKWYTDMLKTLSDVGKAILLFLK